MKRAAAATLRYAFDHRADLLAALVYGCLAYLSFSALADYANRHDLFPEPYGGWAFAVAIDGAVLYAFISFKRAPWMAGALLVAGAASTYTLQRWHAEEVDHPLIVAGVVPGLMVLVTLAWHLIRQNPTSEAGGRRPRQEQEREAGPTTTPPAPAASPPRGRPRSNREVEAPAPGGPTATKSTKSAPGAKDTERSRIARDLFSADQELSGRDLGKAWKVAGVGAGNEKAYEVLRTLKAEGNGSAPPEREQVEA